jgi:hypothetical protein
VAERKRILAELERQPDSEKDGTATWSLSTLQQALRIASDSLPKVSTYTILCVMHDTGWTWQRDRTWCKTGTVGVCTTGEGKIEAQVDLSIAIVVLGSSRSPLFPRRQILFLLWRQDIDLHTHRPQLDLGDLLIDLLRYRVNGALQFASVVQYVLGAQGLVSKGHIHHCAGVALGGSQVD